MLEEYFNKSDPSYSGDISTGITFTPDFDLAVDSNCKYMQITAEAYFNAHRLSNLMRVIRYYTQN
jgi:hypothetical protein